MFNENRHAFVSNIVISWYFMSFLTPAQEHLVFCNIQCFRAPQIHPISCLEHQMAQSKIPEITKRQTRSAFGCDFYRTFVLPEIWVKICNESGLLCLSKIDGNWDLSSTNIEKSSSTYLRSNLHPSESHVWVTQTSQPSGFATCAPKTDADRLGELSVIHGSSAPGRTMWSLVATMAVWWCTRPGIVFLFFPRGIDQIHSDLPQKSWVKYGQKAKTSKTQTHSLMSLMLPWISRHPTWSPGGVLHSAWPLPGNLPMVFQPTPI